MAKLFFLCVQRKPKESDVKVISVAIVAINMKGIIILWPPSYFLGTMFIIFQGALVRILGSEVRDRTKFDAVYTYAKNKLTEYCTEERRKVRKVVYDYYCLHCCQVVGLAPYEKSC